MSDLQGFTADKTVEPTHPQYTNLGLGQGTFDQLMLAVQHHLDTQFNQNRITGPQYAEVYVQSVQAAMTSATQYLLGILFSDQQRAKLEAEASLIAKQEDKIDADIRLVELEELKLKYEMEYLYPLRKQELEATVANLQKQGELIDNQILKIAAEISLMAAQEILTGKQGEKIDAEIANLLKQADLIDQQILKMQQEVLYMQAKVKTENANTIESAAEANSLIGKQKSLLTAQKYAFSGDIKTKLAKMEADYAGLHQGIVEDPNQNALLTSNVKDRMSTALSVGNTIEGV